MTIVKMPGSTLAWTFVAGVLLGIAVLFGFNGPHAAFAQADTTAPTISSIAITSDTGDDNSYRRRDALGVYSIGDSIQITVTFNEDVSVTGAPQLELAIGSSNRTAEYESTDGSAAVFSYTVAEGDSDSDGIAVAANKLSLNGGSIKDAAGNDANLSHNALAAQDGHMVDGIRPTVSAISIFSGGAGYDDVFNIGDEMFANISFSEAVRIGGEPQLTLDFDGEAKTAEWIGDLFFDFSYLIQEGDLDTDGVAIGANALSLNGGTIKDAAGNDAVLTHDAVGAAPYLVVDGVRPTVSSIAITSDPGEDDTYGTGDKIEVTVTFSEKMIVPVVAGDCPDAPDYCMPQLELDIGGEARTAEYQNTKGAAVVFAYNVQAGDTGENGIAIRSNKLTLNGGRIEDAVGIGMGANLADVSHAAVAADTGHKVVGPSLPLTLSGITMTEHQENDDMSVATYWVSGSDAAITWSLSGDDSDDFSIDKNMPQNGVLRFTSPPNYENPTDADTDNLYRVTIQASDGTNVSTLQIVVLVRNVWLDADEVPVISGTVRVGETLTADTSRISVTFSLGPWYWWIRSDGTTDTEIEGATGASYTLTDADAGKTVKVRVNFYAKHSVHFVSLTSEATAMVAALGAEPNSLATGAPVIGGTAQAGETLTVDTSGIDDPDGIRNATFSYQWIAGTTDISGATGSSYAPLVADLGKTIKVRVSFDDDQNNFESLTSAATGAVAASPYGAVIWSGTMIVGRLQVFGVSLFGFDAPNAGTSLDFGDLEPSAFLYAGNSYIIETIAHFSDSGELEFGLDVPLVSGDFILNLDGTPFLVRSDGNTSLYAFSNHGLSWTNGQKVAVRLAVNRTATGAPTISGTAQVGETLTAETDGIEDDDGLSNAAYSYQWLADDVEIAGATNRNYTLATADAGTTIKVQVSFRDDKNNPETLTSEATAAVLANVPGAPEHLNVSLHDTGALDLYWEAPTSDGGSDVTGYKVQWKETAAGWDTPADVSETTVSGTTHTITGLTDGVEYTVRVIASNDVGDGPPSSEATGTPRETTPPVLDGAAVASVTLRDQSQKAATAQIESDDEPYRIGSITVVVAEDILDPDNVVTDLTATWNDVKDCSTDYNAYFLTNGYDIPTIQTGEPSDDPSAYQIHLGSATSSDSQIAKSLSSVEDNRTGFDVKVYCGTVDSGRYVSRVYIPQRWAGPDVHRDKPMPGTYSSEHGLTALTVNPGTLTPAFDSHTLRYTVPDVPNANDQITLTFTAKTGLTAVVMPRAAAWGAGFDVCSLGAFGWHCGGQPYEDEDVLPDADGQAPGLQLNLDEGENQFGIVVWDETVDYLPVTGIYYLTITRTPSQTSQTRAADPAPNSPRSSEESPRGTRVIGGYSLDSSQDSGTPEEATLPELTVIVAGAVLTLTYNEALDEGSVPATDAFTVAVSGTAAEVSHVFVSGSEVTLALASAVTSEDTITVSYTAPTDAAAPRIQDDAGNPAASFSDQDVENNTPLRANTPATGQPTISGTAQVGETLTASTSAIDDADGLDNVGYSYQWIAGTTDISGATGSSYTPLVADVGKTIKVRVSFTDGASNIETLTSEATATVVTPLTAEFRDAPDKHLGTGVFTFVIAFSEPISIGYVTLRDDSLDVTNGSATKAKRVNGQSDRWKITVEPDSDAAVTVVLPITEDCTAQDAVCTRDGTKLSNRSELTVPGPAAANSPATGAPIISGTARVGETLTVDTSGIDDADGMSGAVFSYQWLANEVNIDTDIAGATDPTYTLVDADLDKAVKVRVSFDDDRNFLETLTSEATATVVTPLTAEFQDAPDKHLGTGVFTFVIAFSEPISIGYVTLRDDSLDVTNGSATKAKRVNGHSDRWKITVEPDSNAAVTVVLPITEDCAAQDAVCTRDGTELSNRSELTVPGPAAANSPATGAPIISGTAEVGETLTVDTSGIDDADGMSGAVFSYQWLANDAEITGATGDTYTLVEADFDKAVKVRVIFNDDDDNEETLTSEPTAAVAAKPNSLATGAPTISGTVRVGEILTAHTSDIADADGMSNAEFGFNWWAAEGYLRVTGLNKTYRVQSRDVGLTISVSAGFMDDAGNLETLSSAETGAVAPTTPAPPQNLNVSLHGTGELDLSWEAPISDLAGEIGGEGTHGDGGSPITGYKVQWKSGSEDYDGSAGSTRQAEITDPASRTHTITGLTDGVEYAVRVIAVNDVGDGPPSDEATGTPRETTLPELATATVDGTTLTLTYDEALDENSEPSPDAFSVTVGGMGRAVDGVSVSGSSVILTLASAVTATDTVTVSYTVPTDAAAPRIQDEAGNPAAPFSDQEVENNTPPPANTPATGAPTITGTVRVGETLTADISGIDDADGLDNVGYSYQWLANGADIAGATSSSYTLVEADAGLTIQVKVSFRDDRNHPETLTSVATAAVEPRPNSPATGAPTISGTVRVGETLTVDISGIDDADGMSGAVFSYQWLANGADIAGATSSTYTPVADDAGLTIQVKVSFRDDRNHPETLTSVATAAVEPRPNSPATGAPTISGTARVGETLTVDISGIDDADGMSGAVFSYQWLANGADIAGATSSTYTPVADDAGLTIQVKVSFRDDRNHPETLTSVATAAVEPRPNSPATGAPTISGTARVGETLTVDISGIDDADGMSGAVFSYQWLANGADIAGATSSTYTPVADDAGLTIQVKVSFRDDRNHPETLTSVATAAVEPRPNSPATGAPTISGTARVGETLTVDISGIDDADGMSGAVFSYQWLANGADIAGATSSTYTPVADDAGLTIKVNVSFRDDRNHQESLTSAATAAVTAAADDSAVWSATLTVGSIAGYLGFWKDVGMGELTSEVFTLDGVDYTVKVLADSDGPQFYLTLDKALPVGFTLQVGATTLSSQDASIREFSSGATQYGWATNQGAVLADVDTVEVSLTASD